MKIIDGQLLEDVQIKAKESPRLRMNYNFHQSLDNKRHRFLNAVEPGTIVPIHRHPTKDESFVILRGKAKVSTYNDDGTICDSIILCPEKGRYGIDIPKNIWHTIESLGMAEGQVCGNIGLMVQGLKRTSKKWRDSGFARGKRYLGFRCQRECGTR